MASPPPYNNTSPPAPSSLALPRQRPSVNTLALPTGAPNPRRKPSTASASSLSHPLRQTSFPPDSRLDNGNVAYSPEGDEFSDSEITSAISQPTGPGDGEGGGKKRKRGEKKSRGRPPKNPRAGSAGAEDARSAVNQGGNTAGADAEADDDEDEKEDETAESTAAKNRETEALEAMEALHKDLHSRMFADTEWQFNRHSIYKRSKLRTADVRKLINQTLSQSVPQNVVTVVGAYTKMFAGLLVEGARDVQAEWMAVEDKRPDGEPNRVAKRLAGQDEAEEKIFKEEPTSSGQTNGHANSDDTQPDADMHDGEGTNGMTSGHHGGGEEYEEVSMGLRRQVEEIDRGPLLPDHLRESLRRYKKARYGGTVGFTGLSLEGKDVAAPRMGGRRLFR